MQQPQGMPPQGMHMPQAQMHQMQQVPQGFNNYSAVMSLFQDML